MKRTVYLLAIAGLASACGALDGDAVTGRGKAAGHDPTAEPWAESPAEIALTAMERGIGAPIARGCWGKGEARMCVEQMVDVDQDELPSPGDLVVLSFSLGYDDAHAAFGSAKPQRVVLALRDLAGEDLAAANRDMTAPDGLPFATQLALATRDELSPLFPSGIPKGMFLSASEDERAPDVMMALSLMFAVLGNNQTAAAQGVGFQTAGATGLWYLFGTFKKKTGPLRECFTGLSRGHLDARAMERLAAVVVNANIRTGETDPRGNLQSRWSVAAWCWGTLTVALGIDSLWLDNIVGIPIYDTIRPWSAGESPYID